MRGKIGESRKGRLKLLNLRRRDLRRVANLLAELEDVTVVVAYRELAHAIVETLQRIYHVGSIFDLVPQSIHIGGVEIERPVSTGFSNGSCALGRLIINSTLSLRSAAQPSNRFTHTKPSRLR